MKISLAYQIGVIGWTGDPYWPMNYWSKPLWITYLLRANHTERRHCLVLMVSQGYFGDIPSLYLQFDIKVRFGEAVRYGRGKGGTGEGVSHERFVKAVLQSLCRCSYLHCIKLIVWSWLQMHMLPKSCHLRLDFFIAANIAEVSWLIWIALVGQL